MRPIKLDQQTIAALVFAALLLIAGVFILTNSGDDDSDDTTDTAAEVTATDTPDATTTTTADPTAVPDGVPDDATPSATDDAAPSATTDPTDVPTATTAPTTAPTVVGMAGPFELDARAMTERDADADGVADGDDVCPTRGDLYGEGVDAEGCPVVTYSINVTGAQCQPADLSPQLGFSNASPVATSFNIRFDTGQPAQTVNAAPGATVRVLAEPGSSGTATISVAATETELGSIDFDCTPPPIMPTSTCFTDDNGRGVLFGLDVLGGNTPATDYTVTVTDDAGVVVLNTARVNLGPDDSTVLGPFYFSTHNPDRRMVMFYETGPAAADWLYSEPCLAAPVRLAAPTCAPVTAVPQITLRNTSNAPRDLTVSFAYANAEGEADLPSSTQTLAPGATATFSGDRPGAGTLTISVGDDALDSQPFECVPPAVTVNDVVCAADGGGVSFLLAAGPGVGLTRYALPVTVTDENGDLVLQDDILLNLDGEQPLTVRFSNVPDNPASRLTLRYDNRATAPTEITAGPCLEVQPTVEVVHNCTTEGTDFYIVDRSALGSELNWTVESSAGLVRAGAVTASTDPDARRYMGTLDARSGNVQVRLGPGLDAEMVYDAPFDCAATTVRLQDAQCGPGGTAIFTLRSVGGSQGLPVQLEVFEQVNAELHTPGLYRATRTLLPGATWVIGDDADETLAFQSSPQRPGRELVLQYQTNADGDTATAVVGPCFDYDVTLDALCTAEGQSVATVRNNTTAPLDVAWLATNLAAPDATPNAGTLSLPAEAENILQLPYPNVELRLMLVGSELDLGSTAITCALPQISVIESTCAPDNSAAHFTLSAGGGTTPYTTQVTLTDADGNVVASGQQLMASGSTWRVHTALNTRFAPDDSTRELTLTYSVGPGASETATVGPCLPLELDAEVQCSTQDDPLPRLHISSNRRPDAALSYDISYAAVEVADTGNLELDDDFSARVGLRGGLAGEVTIRQGGAVLLRETFDCRRPEITATATCVNDNQVRFTLSPRLPDPAQNLIVQVLEASSGEVLLDDASELDDPFSFTVDFPEQSLEDALDDARRLELRYRPTPGTTASVSAGPCLSRLAIETATCAEEGAAAAVDFSIVNTVAGPVDGRFTVVDETGFVIHTPTAPTFTVAPNASIELSSLPFTSDAAGRALTLLVYEDGSEGAVASARVGPCAPPQPQLSIESTCSAFADNPGVQFTFSADAATLTEPLRGTYTVLNAQNIPVSAGAFQVGPGEARTVNAVFAPDNTSPDRTLTLVLEDEFGNRTRSVPAGPCGGQSVRVMQHCVPGGTRLDIYNTGPLTLSADYRVSYADESLDTRSGTLLQLAPGASRSLRVEAAPGTLELDGQSFAITSCAAPLLRTVCNANSSFPQISMLNPRAEPLPGVAYRLEYTQGSGPSSGQFGNVAAGATAMLGIDQYAAGVVTVDYAGGEPLSAEFSCLGAPDVTLSSTCDNATGVVTFTATRSDGFFAGEVPYSISTGDGGTLDFSQRDELTVAVNAPLDGSPVEMVLDEGGRFATSLTVAAGCAQALNLDIIGYCEGFNAPAAVLVNAAEVATQPLAWTLNWSNGTSDSGTFSLQPGRQLTLRPDVSDQALGMLTLAGTDISAEIPGCSPPTVAVQPSCAGATGASFTVNVGSSDFAFEAQWRIQDANGSTVASGSDIVSGAGTFTYNADFASLADDRNLTLNWGTPDGTLAATAESGPCLAEPDPVVNATCNPALGEVTFTVTNNGGPLREGLAWVDSTGATGTTAALGPDGDQQTFVVDAPDDGSSVSLVLDPDGPFAQTLTLENGCAQTALDLSLDAVCEDYGDPAITLTNNGDTDATAVPWALDFDNGSSVAGRVDVAAGATQTLSSLPAGGAGVFRIAETGYELRVPTCAEPELRISGQCEGFEGVSFTLTNNGGDMLGQGTWRVTNPVGGTVATSDPGYQLASGASATFTVPFAAGYEPGRFLTVSVFNDFNDDRLEYVSTACLPPQRLNLAAACVPGEGEIVFEVRNVGGPMAQGLPFAVARGGATLLEGITDQLVSGEMQRFNVTAPANGALVVFDVRGPGGDRVAIEGCVGHEPLGLAGYCSADGSGAFSIVNAGVDMEISGAPLYYAVTNQDGVPLDNGTLSLAAAEVAYLYYDFLGDTLTLTASTGPVSRRLAVGGCVVE